MDTELGFDIEFRREQRGDAEDPRDAPPARRPLPRGRPWVKGQSGNPAGRPPRIHRNSAVAEHLIGQKTIPLTKKLIQLALAGDRAALRLCIERIAPPRRGPEEWLGAPVYEDRKELQALATLAAEAAEKGAITPAQGEALVRIATTLFEML